MERRASCEIARADACTYGSGASAAARAAATRVPRRFRRGDEPRRQALFMRNLLETAPASAARRRLSRPRHPSAAAETVPKSGLRPGVKSRVVLGSGGAAYKSGLVQARGTVRLPCARVPHHPSGRHRSPEPCGPRRPRGAAQQHKDDGPTPTARGGVRRRRRRVPTRSDFCFESDEAAHEGF